MYIALIALSIFMPLILLLPQPVRGFVAFVFLLAAPGAAVTTFVRIRDPLSEGLLAVTMSLALMVAAGQTMLWLGRWNPAGLSVMLAPPTALILAGRVAAGQMRGSRSQTPEIVATTDAGDGTDARSETQLDPIAEAGREAGPDVEAAGLAAAASEACTRSTAITPADADVDAEGGREADAPLEPVVDSAGDGVAGAALETGVGSEAASKPEPGGPETLGRATALTDAEAAVSGDGAFALLGTVRDDGPPLPGRPLLVLQVVALGLALVLWLLSLRHVNLNRINDLGLVSVLPPAFIAALLVLTAGFWSLLFAERWTPWLLAGYVAALVLMMHGTTAILYAEPRYTYVYKHIGVANYINLHGSVDRRIDIYQNWPGFFSAVAVLSKVSGVSALAFANGAQVFFAGCDALAVRFVAQGLTSDRRRVWCTVWLYILADWIGQNYLAPQAFGFLLSLTAIGIVLHYLQPTESNGSPRLRGRRLRAPRQLTRLLGGDEKRHDVALTTGMLPQPLAAGLVLLFASCVVVSHQLSPLLLTEALFVLVACGRCRLRWLPFAILAMTMAWFGFAHTVLAEHFRLFAEVGDIGANSSGTGIYPGSAYHQRVANYARLLSLVVVVLAGVGWLSRARAGMRETAAVALAMSPIPLLGLQSYGGEGIYRVYLFALPWCSFLAAGTLYPRACRRSLGRPVAGFALASALIPLMLVSYFGLERVNYVRPEEVSLEGWFESHVPAGSVLAEISGNSPGQLSGRYNQFFLPNGNWGFNLVGLRRFARRELGPADVSPAVQALRAAGGSPVYLMISPGQEAYAEGFGLSPPGAVDRFARLLLRRREFRVVRRAGSSALMLLR